MQLYADNGDNADSADDMDQAVETAELGDDDYNANYEDVYEDFGGYSSSSYEDENPFASDGETKKTVSEETGKDAATEDDNANITARTTRKRSLSDGVVAFTRASAGFVRNPAKSWPEKSNYLNGDSSFNNASNRQGIE